MILILAALQDEIKYFLNEIDVLEKVVLRPSEIFRGEYKGKDILIARTGIGKEKMKRAASFCIKEYNPETIINVGYCGALIPDLAVGDIVISSEVVDESSGKSLKAIQPKIETDESLTYKIANGNSLTVSKVIGIPHEKAYLGTKFNAISVDMESSGLAEAAHEAGREFMVVRSVLDSMDMKLPEFGGTLTDGGEVSPVGFVAHTITKPSSIFKLPQFEHCSRKAKQSLADILNKIIL